MSNKILIKKILIGLILINIFAAILLSSIFFNFSLNDLVISKEKQYSNFFNIFITISWPVIFLFFGLYINYQRK